LKNKKVRHYFLQILPQRYKVDSHRTGTVMGPGIDQEYIKEKYMNK
jgi:hypothetical protein